MDAELMALREEYGRLDPELPDAPLPVLDGEGMMFECGPCLEKARAHGWPCPRGVLETLSMMDGADRAQLAAIAAVASELVDWLAKGNQTGSWSSYSELARAQIWNHAESLRKALAEAGVTGEKTHEER